MRLVDSPEAVRVLVVAAGAAVRDAAVSELLAAGIDVVAACGTAAEAVDAVRREAPDVCVVADDAAVRALAAVHPGIGLVVAAPVLTESGLADAIVAGAHAYVVRGADPPQLAAAIRVVAAGHVVYPRRLMQAALGSHAA